MNDIACKAYVNVVPCEGNESNGFVYTWKLLSQDGSELPDSNYEKIIEENDILIVSKNKKYGIVSRYNGNVLIPTQYNYICPFSDYEKKVFLVNTNGHVKTEHGETKISGGKWGVIEKNGNTLIEPIYDYIELGSNNPLYYRINNGGKVQFSHHVYWGLDGKRTCEKIESYCFGGSWGLFDNHGNVLLDIIYNFLEPFKNNSYARISTDCMHGCNDYFGGKWGVYDKHGKIVVPIIYDEIREIKKNLPLTIRLDDRYAIVQLDKWEVELNFDDIGEFNIDKNNPSSYTVQVRTANKKMVLDEKNNIRSEVPYFTFEEFSYYENDIVALMSDRGATELNYI